MTPSRYGPFPYWPITRRPRLEWPHGARLAVWVNPNIEFFRLDDIMPGNVNERVPREHAKVPHVRNWSLRDFGNRVGVWRLMKVLSRYGVRATAALNSEVCDHHPQIVEEALRLGWELMGHGQTNAVRLNEASPEQERDSIFGTLDRIERASGVRPTGWLGPGLAETWRTLEYLSEAGIRYVCDWINDEQPYTMDVGHPRLVSLPYSVQANDAPAYFDNKCTVPEFERILKDQFDVLYQDSAESGRVMAIAVHPFITGQPHRIVALERALEHICSHDDVWLATGREIVAHYQQSAFARIERESLAGGR
jgi:peptidoglycan/xylan/chitin deacetylase (PgdA/CDA1 family)